eukprot:TRINITY_DN3162_c0_g1_i2.p1 TRINITY_DN3162_c0_g1~~TRINITY_DN3162_c0_g1_i2.p1  ORF type:complete len:202 (+),score=54.17 TRINITY_DN3162_c0_g1_i2:33-608(+)
MGHDRVGPAVRQLLYYHMLCRPWIMLPLYAKNTGWGQKLFSPFLWLMTWGGLKIVFPLNSTQARVSMQTLEEEFDYVEQLLQQARSSPSGPPSAASPAAHVSDEKQASDSCGSLCGPFRFLVGDTLTSTDITFAALAALVVGVTHENGYGAWLPNLDCMPEELHDFMSRLRNRPAGQWILEMYAQTRRRKE